MELSKIATNHADLCFNLLQNCLNGKLVNVTKDIYSIKIIVSIFINFHESIT